MRMDCRIAGVAALMILVAATGAPLKAETLKAETSSVLACDTLVNLRVLMGSGDRATAEAALPGHPGCRRIQRDRIGTAEHRAMVGGAPFECLTVTGEGSCAWVWP